MNYEVKDGIFPEIARRTMLQILPDGGLGIAFFKTPPSVPPTPEAHYFTFRVEEVALGELFMHLKQAVEQNPEKFGFEKR